MSRETSAVVPAVRKLRIIGAIAAVVSALFHIPIALSGFLMPDVIRPFFAEAVGPVAIFFFVLAVFQLIWAGVMLGSGNRLLIVLGILGFTGSITLYFISTAVELPFGVPRQPLNPFAIVTKVVEGVFVINSLYLLKALPK